MAQFLAAYLVEQPFLAAEFLAHSEKVELVAQHGTHAHELVTMPEQLPEIPLRGCGNSDPRKALGQQQIENVRGLALIGLLFTHHTGANLRGVPQSTVPARARTDRAENVLTKRRADRIRGCQ